MSEYVTIRIDGKQMTVPAGTLLSTAIAMAGHLVCRRSVTGQPRGPLCGIGVCFECRVTINGEPHCRSCRVVCQEGMEVVTDG